MTHLGCTPRLEACCSAATWSGRPLKGCSRKHGQGEAPCSPSSARPGSASRRCSTGPPRRPTPSSSCGRGDPVGGARAVRRSFELLRPALDRLDAIPAPQAAALESALALRPGRAENRFAVGVRSSPAGRQGGRRAARGARRRRALARRFERRRTPLRGSAPARRSHRSRALGPRRRALAPRRGRPAASWSRVWPPSPRPSCCGEQPDIGPGALEWLLRETGAIRSPSSSLHVSVRPSSGSMHRRRS